MWNWVMELFSVVGAFVILFFIAMLVLILIAAFDDIKYYLFTKKKGKSNESAVD